MNKNQTAKVVSGVALVGALALTGAYAVKSIAQEPSSQTSSIEQTVVDDECKPDDKCVEITFTDKGCPVEVSDDDFEVKNTKHIVWQSVDAGGDPIVVDYEIYFDPFKGQPHKGVGNGRIKRKIDDKAPATYAGQKAIEYKYTIYGVPCTQGTDMYLDPRFTVRR